jgi:hypothetical protein
VIQLILEALWEPECVDALTPVSFYVSQAHGIENRCTAKKRKKGLKGVDIISYIRVEHRHLAGTGLFDLLYPGQKVCFPATEDQIRLSLLYCRKDL